LLSPIGVITKELPLKTSSTVLCPSHACAIARGTVITAALFPKDLENLLLNFSSFIFYPEKKILLNIVHHVKFDNFLYWLI
jgi:hypothetical protein